ncbi:uncharacterized protein BP5553_07776 [Venustampulla echinocandica]|uniref:SHSP domain-containing protein n=1 Tax=Venustampulla echinocandica TaxID=2656787 RepID=A0A370THI6_9HELO|nr:uncharacterized protein BP5553_07776 [Venustampulla echinocandica]RDL34648.1 hypothetical protein BP5553_07776 [Venustampulla echinocandica]
MAYNNNYQQGPFWDFARSFGQNGAGVDHPADGFGSFGPPPYQAHHGGFGFGGPPGGWGSGAFGSGPWARGGHHGRRGRHCHRRDGSHEGHRRRSRDPPADGENPDDSEERESSPHGRRGRRGHHGRGGHRGGWGGHGPRGPPPFGGFGGIDLNGLMAALSTHPLAQTFRDYAGQAGFAAGGPQRSGETPEDVDTENTFIPPIDVFSTEKQFVLHVALPGARKEDVGVNWDEEKGVLNLAGVVYRQGDEAFLETLTQSERKVGMFERTIKLPPGDGEKEEVDGDAITAKLEDGILVVTVPKVEKEWTEVKRVDIE